MRFSIFRTSADSSSPGQVFLVLPRCDIPIYVPKESLGMKEVKELIIDDVSKHLVREIFWTDSDSGPHNLRDLIDEFRKDRDPHTPMNGGSGPMAP